MKTFNITLGFCAGGVARTALAIKPNRARISVVVFNANISRCGNFRAVRSHSGIADITPAAAPAGPLKRLVSAIEACRARLRGGGTLGTVLPIGARLRC